MAKFRISSHGRLQDWIAAEKRYFNDEGLDYEMDVRALENAAQDIAVSPEQDVRVGAYELYLSGGGGGNDRLSGGPGNDRITPGPGRDRVFAGAGNDRVFSRDSRRDVIDCGPGRDVAIVDRIDRTRRCETVIRAPRRR
jgi:hypothetical protein